MYFLPVSHTGHSLDLGLVERNKSLHGSLPSRSVPWLFSLWHYEHGQTPSPVAERYSLKKFISSTQPTYLGQNGNSTNMQRLNFNLIMSTFKGQKVRKG